MVPYSFERHKEINNIKETTPNKQKSSNLRKDAQYRLNFFTKITNYNAKIALENHYEAIRLEIEALLAEAGYKSYSHEATFSFVKNILSSEENQYLARLRMLRNQSRYEAKKINLADAEVAQIRAPMIIKKLREEKSNQQSHILR